MELLTEDEIVGRLGGVPGWSRQGSSIVTTVTQSDFRGALLFTGAVAYVAEQANHHPDIDIRYNKVTMSLVSHDSGGVTQRDLRMAGRINQVAG